VEKCKSHPNKDIDMLCKECQVPICSKCVTQENHWGHRFIDLETVYADKMALCLEEISKVDMYFLLTSHELKNEIKGDATEIKIIMDSLRAAMKADGESLKNLVDTTVAENMQQVDNIEKSLLEKLHSQDTTYDDYISYLHDHLKELYGYLSSSKLSNIIPRLSERFPQIRSIPWTTKPVTPVFTAGQYSKDDVAKLLGKINFKDTKAEIRKIKPMEIVFPSTSKQQEQDIHKKSDIKQTYSLSPSVTEVRTFNVPDVNNVVHISLHKPGRLWASDSDGNLVQTDLQGNQLQKIQTNGTRGYHTVTQDGELIFTDRGNKVIKKIMLDKKITELKKSIAWIPTCIHSSHINGDILVGMVKPGEAKVTRYNKTGEELISIQKDSKGQELYRNPLFITENINGDVCVSDRGVVVINNLGQYRFSYTGHGLPYGICTDAIGHILVCDGDSNISDGVHLLDQDGQFLCRLLPRRISFLGSPMSVCVDDENYLYVGQSRTNTVTVYKYIH
jgi:hypothetical protein